MQYQEYTDGISTWRDGVRSGDFVVDIELTPTGFAGLENIDWENVSTIPKA
jgi:hypothetical protein